MSTVDEEAWGGLVTALCVSILSVGPGGSRSGHRYLSRDHCGVFTSKGRRAVAGGQQVRALSQEGRGWGRGRRVGVKPSPPQLPPQV